jgi:hypothetical protein
VRLHSTCTSLGALAAPFLIAEHPRGLLAGWINVSIERFICDSFGEDKWNQVLAASGEKYPWVSSCPYADAVTYNLVITGAGILGVTVEQALEAYGVYFIRYTNMLVRLRAAGMGHTH